MIPITHLSIFGANIKIKFGNSKFFLYFCKNSWDEWFLPQLYYKLVLWKLSTTNESHFRDLARCLWVHGYSPEKNMKKLVFQRLPSIMRIFIEHSSVTLVFPFLEACYSISCIYLNEYSSFHCISEEKIRIRV